LGRMDRAVDSIYGSVICKLLDELGPGVLGLREVTEVQVKEVTGDWSPLWCTSSERKGLA